MSGEEKDESQGVGAIFVRIHHIPERLGLFKGALYWLLGLL